MCTMWTSFRVVHNERGLVMVVPNAIQSETEDVAARVTERTNKTFAAERAGPTTSKETNCSYLGIFVLGADSRDTARSPATVI